MVKLGKATGGQTWKGHRWSRLGEPWVVEFGSELAALKAHAFLAVLAALAVSALPVPR